MESDIQNETCQVEPECEDAILLRGRGERVCEDTVGNNKAWRTPYFQPPRVIEVFQSALIHEKNGVSELLNTELQSTRKGGVIVKASRFHSLE